jgi:hypothetical protein
MLRPYVRRAEDEAQRSLPCPADEFEALGEAIEAYESLRWPRGKEDGGKGGA